MNLAEIREAVRIDLADVAEAKWNPESLDRAIQRAVWDLSRKIPQEKLHQHKVEYTIEDETFDSATLGTVVSLSGTPVIVPKSEAVTSKPAGTDFTRDTDYTMDYSAGTITVLATGSMIADTDYLISYTKSKVIIDVSSLTDLIRVSMVEYPAGKIPMETVSFTQWGDDLEIVCGTESQKALTEDDYLFIYYQAYHTMPTETVDGSFPTFLGEVIVKGSAAYALMSRALEMQHSGDDNEASAVAALVLAEALHSSITTALTSATTEATKADTALDKVASEVAKASTALGKVQTHGSAADSAFDAIAALVTSAGSALSGVATLVTAAGSDIDSGHGVWSDLDDYIVGAGGIKGAQPLLQDGISFLNTVNLGADVGELYRRYSESEVAIAGLWSLKADRYISGAGVRINGAMVRVNEASQYISAAQARVGEGTGRVGLADAFVAEGAQRLSAAAAYISEATQRLAHAGIHMQEAVMYLERIEAYLAEADRYTALIDNDLELVVIMRNEGLQRRSEFWEVLEDRKQYMKKRSMVSRRQYSS